ncbi:SDR family NAD(P)-dependent oxidoreductase [Rhizobium sp. YK2]|uniref:SDR family NAD(P)-dependent oxidoreductase n=1 Tax=Rhizobium sp. YK2 TaxID=1860096 RepID=UPI00084C9011|nr:SDR family NAD(P)-dependent oxidoreductase [Rhizobium sp. YK2]OED00688.1 short-chain dehydrogenase [Rhizobium sp. YK2]
MSKDVSGLRFIVVGGAAGIGFATARMLVARGAKVAVIDRDQPGLGRAKADLGEELVAALQGDLLDTAGFDAVFERAVAALGGLDGLVNCAGIDLLKPAETMSDAEWDRVLAVNLTGPMRTCQSALPYLKNSPAGAIVNLSSGAGLMPLANRTAYCTAKAGLVMMSKALAMEWAPYGIRVNAICPGAVDTPLFRTSYEYAADPVAQLEQIKARYALARIAEPDELAEAITFLVSPAASYITGVALAVDGGRTFH